MNFKVLVTGYKPFQNIKENVSEKVVRNLIYFYRPLVIPLIMPVEWRTARRMILAAVKKEKPDIIVSLGHDPDAEALRLEPVLVNASIFKDETGKFPPTPYIVKNETEWRQISLPFEEIKRFSLNAVSLRLCRVFDQTLCR